MKDALCLCFVILVFFKLNALSVYNCRPDELLSIIIHKALKSDVSQPGKANVPLINDLYEH